MIRAVPSVLTAALAASAVVIYSARAAPIITDSDFALTELYVELASHGQLLVGPSSRFGWHHPGPLYFYALAPLYVLSGRSAVVLYAGAVAINLVALLVIVQVLRRERRAPTAAAIVVACLLFAWRVPRFLASPWTAHVPILASVTFLVIAAAVAAGRVRLLPLMIVAGSFIAQTHVGFVPLVAVISVAVLLSVWKFSAEPTTALKKPLYISAAVGVALWAPVIIDAFLHRGGNLAALWRFFVSDADAGHSIATAIVYGGYGLAGVLRPDFDLPWGGRVTMEHLPWSLAAAGLQLALLGVIGWRDAIAGRRFDATLAFVAIAASVIGILGLMRVRGDILGHDLFRLAVLGAFNLGVIMAAGARHAAQVFSGIRSGLLIGTVAASVAAFALWLGARDLQSLTAHERGYRSRRSVLLAYESIRNYISSHNIRRPLFEVGPDRWADTAGVVLRCVQNEIPVAVKGYEGAFAGRFTPTGDEDALITLADLELHRQLRVRAGNTILLESHPLFVDAVRVDPRAAPR